MQILIPVPGTWCRYSTVGHVLFIHSVLEKNPGHIRRPMLGQN